MQYQVISCPRCSSLNIKKNGKTAQQKQRYRCRACQRQFITDYTYRACQSVYRSLIVPLTLNSCGIRDTARVLGISPTTVLKVLRAAATQLGEPPPPARIQDLELDEFWSFVGRKKAQRWCWYGWDRQRKRITAYVLGRRTDATFRRLLQKHAGARIQRYHTDDWQSYRKLLPAQRHWIHKAGTQHIERRNLDFRTRLKRLQRRTNCFSKNVEMHDLVLNLYVYYSNK